MFWSIAIKIFQLRAAVEQRAEIFLLREHDAGDNDEYSDSPFYFTLVVTITVREQ